jgi:hypothetical protein
LCHNLPTGHGRLKLHRCNSRASRAGRH